MMDLQSIKENQQVYVDLIERGWTDETIKTATAKELFSEWLDYNGIINYSSTIRNVLWTLITSSDKYLMTTDQEKEEWLKSLLGFGLDPV